MICPFPAPATTSFPSDENLILQICEPVSVDPERKGKATYTKAIIPICLSSPRVWITEIQTDVFLIIFSRT
jgi:hypothetical protein